MQKDKLKTLKDFKEMEYQTIYQCNVCSSIFASNGTEEMLECLQCGNEDYNFMTLTNKQLKMFTSLYHKYRERFEPKESFKKALEDLNE